MSRFTAPKVPGWNRLAVALMSQQFDEPGFVLDLFIENARGHVVSARVFARENTLSACGRARLRPNIVFESGQFTTILAMVGGGTGVSVVPQMAVERRKGCRFIPIADEGAYRRVAIVQLKQHFRSRAHTTFLRHLQHSAAGMS